MFLLLPAETGPVGKCKCLRTSNTVLQVQRVKSYYVQKSGLCHVDAVVFTTVRGIAVCSDPKKTKASLPPSSPAVPTKTAASRPTRITTGDLGLTFTTCSANTTNKPSCFAGPDSKSKAGCKSINWESGER
uniref:Chemokine interleukin-8-like domain-containing protein n=1 Tax=Astyanax mexicanus TaxID=7994 RepID=A0A3B1KGZ3_ASTMX